MALIISPWNRPKTSSHILQPDSLIFLKEIPLPICTIHAPVHKSFYAIANQPIKELSIHTAQDEERQQQQQQQQRSNPCTQSIWASENRNSCSTKFVFV
jgi:hypothetical protein